MGDRIAIMQRGRQARPVRDPGRAADGARRRVRRGLRRRRPGAEAAGADAGRATSTSGRRRSPTSASRPPRCGRSSRAPRSPTRCWSTPSGGRSAGSPSATCARETVPAQPDSPLGPGARPRRRDARRARRPAPGARPSTRRWSTAEGRIAGVLSVEIISEFLGSPEAKIEEHAAAERPHGLMTRRSSRLAAAARPGATIHERTGRQRCPARPAEQALLLRLGDGQHRPLHDADCSSTWCSVLISVADRLRDRLRARAARPPPPLAASAALGGDRRPLHDPQHRLLLPAAADHRARPRHGDHRPHRLHAADHLPQHVAASPTSRPTARTPAAGWG